MPGLEKTNLPAGRPSIEGGFGVLDSAGEACETAGTPVKCSPWFVQGPEILQLKQKIYEAGLSGDISLPHGIDLEGAILQSVWTN